MRIRDISRVYDETPAVWMGLMRELEEGQDVMPKQYSPLRSAIVAELKTAGSGAALLEAGLATFSKTKGQESIKENSRLCFRNFQEKIQPQLVALNKSFLGGGASLSPVVFASTPIQGGFHLCATTNDGDTVYMYLYPSKWKPKQETAMIELLSIIGEQRHKCSRESVWFVDVQQGTVRHPAVKNTQIRQKLKATIEALARFMGNGPK